MSAIELFARPEWERVGLTLLHFVWQGAAVAGIVAIAAVMLRRGRARYAAYLIGLGIMAFCPLVSYCVIDVPTRIVAGEIASVAQGDKVTGEIVVGNEKVIDRAAGAATGIEGKLIQGGQRVDRAQQLRTWLPWAVALWVVGVSVLSVRLLVGVIGIRRWRRDRQLLPVKIASRVERLCRRMGLGRLDGVFGSTCVKQPMAMGYWRPMVLLPVAWLSQMPVGMLEAVIAHELAHICRWDLWVNLAQRMIETVLFYHPAVWWLSARVRAEREICCDEMAVEVTGKRVEYASALELAAREECGEAMLAVALGHGRKVLLGRVRHVLGLPTEKSPWNWPAGVVGLILVLVVGIGAAVLRAQEPKTTPATQPAPVKMLHMVDVVVGPEEMTFQGEAATWDDVAMVLEGLLDPKQTVLEVAVSSNDVKTSRYREAMEKASELVQKYGLAYVSNTGVKPLGAKGVDVPDTREAQKGGGDQVTVRRNVLLVVGTDKMTFEGQETSEAELAELVEKLVTDPKHTQMEVAVDSADRPMSLYLRAISLGIRAMEKCGIPYFDDVGVRPLGAKADDADGRKRLVGPNGEVIEADQIVVDPATGKVEAKGNVKVERREEALPKDMEKERANRMKCASNLRRINQAMMLYANEHDGAYPPDLGMLVTVATLNAQAFVCPSAWREVPGEVWVDKQEVAAKWINAHTDYVYLAAKMNANKEPADTVLAYEKMKDHAGEGVNMMFNDGHAEWVGHNLAVRMIAQLTAGQNPPKAWLDAVDEANTKAAATQPAIDMDKERANRVKCATNLRQINQGIVLYTNDHKGQYPPDLGAVVKEKNLPVTSCICPSSKTEVPLEVLKGKPEEKAKWVNEHAGYVYLGAKMVFDKSIHEKIIAYEKADGHQGDGINVLFGDGHVERMAVEKAMEMVKKQQEKLGSK